MNYASIESAVTRLEELAPGQLWIRHLPARDYGSYGMYRDWCGISLTTGERWLIYEKGTLVVTAPTLDEAMAKFERKLDPELVAEADSRATVDVPDEILMTL